MKYIFTFFVVLMAADLFAANPAFKDLVFTNRVGVIQPNGVGANTNAIAILPSGKVLLGETANQISTFGLDIVDTFPFDPSNTIELNIRNKVAGGAAQGNANLFVYLDDSPWGEAALNLSVDANGSEHFNIDVSTDGILLDAVWLGQTVIEMEPTAAAGVTPYTFDTSLTHTSGNLFEVKNNTTNKFTVGWDGAVTGNGSGLTNQNAANISAGTLADARLSANVAVLDRARQVFTGATNLFNSVDLRQPSAGVMLYGRRQSDSGGGTGSLIRFKDTVGTDDLYRVDTGGNTVQGKLKLQAGTGGDSGQTYILDAGDWTTFYNEQLFRFRQTSATGGNFTSFGIEINRVNANLGGYSALLVNATEDAVGTATSLLLNLQRNTNNVFTVNSSGEARLAGSLIMTNGGSVLNNVSTTPNKVGGVLKTIVTPVGNVGGGLDTLMTYTIPASQLGANGEALEFDCWGYCTNNANTKAITVFYGGTVLIDTTALVLNGVSWRAHGKIVRTGAATQTATCEFTVGGTLLSAVNGTITLTTAPAETLSGTVVFNCTGTSAISPNDNDIVQTGMVLKWLPAGN